MNEEQIKKLLQICIKWNKRNLESRKAMGEIWNLLWPNPLKKAWNSECQNEN